MTMCVSIAIVCVCVFPCTWVQAGLPYSKLESQPVFLDLLAPSMGSRCCIAQPA